MIENILFWYCVGYLGTWGVIGGYYVVKALYERVVKSHVPKWTDKPPVM